MNATTDLTTELDRALAAFPIYGGTAPTGNYGIVPRGDALVSQLSDGTDLNAVWTELIDILDLWNKERTSIVQLLSFFTTASADVVPQSISSVSFEQASELGVPKAAGTPADALPLGYTFQDWDLRSSFTWKFLRDADRRQVDAIIESILNSDNKLTTGHVLRRIFDPAEKRNEHSARVFGLYNGVDSITAPPHLGRTFDSSTTHLLRSGATVLDSGDIEFAYRLIRDKGYGLGNGSQLLIIAHPDDAEAVQAWRSGEPSREPEGAETTGPLARHDWIPAKTAPPYLTPDSIVGQPVTGEYHGVPVLGSYGPGWLIESPFVPSGYVLVAASGGPNSPANVIGFREHPVQSYRGLRVIPGAGQYPLVDAFHQRSFGVGVRQRGAAVAINIGTGSTYTAPTAQIPI